MSQRIKPESVFQAQQKAIIQVKHYVLFWEMKVCFQMFVDDALMHSFQNSTSDVFAHLEVRIANQIPEEILSNAELHHAISQVC